MINNLWGKNKYSSDSLACCSTFSSNNLEVLWQVNLQIDMLYGVLIFVWILVFLFCLYLREMVFCFQKVVQREGNRLWRQSSLITVKQKVYSTVLWLNTGPKLSLGAPWITKPALTTVLQRSVHSAAFGLKLAAGSCFLFSWLLLIWCPSVGETMHKLGSGKKPLN